MPPATEPTVRDAPMSLADGIARADAAAADAAAAADDADAAAADAATEREDAQLAAGDARESLQALQSHRDECPVGTPVDCGDGTCASSIYACSPLDAGPAPAERVDETAELLTDEERRAAAEEEAEEEDGGVADSEGCTAGAAGATGAAAGASAVAFGVILLAASRVRRRRPR